MALGELGGLSQTRRVLVDTLEIAVYEPQDVDVWNEAYGRYCEMIGNLEERK